MKNKKPVYKQVETSHPCKYCGRVLRIVGWESPGGCLWCDRYHPNNVKEQKPDK